MAWVLWDAQREVPFSIMQNLPDNLQGHAHEDLARLGYRQLVIEHPDNYIPRFSALTGMAKFRVREDGRVVQYFVDSDFSVAAVRNELKNMANRDAGTTLEVTDWYVVRFIETGKEIPEDVVKIRQMQRDQLDWIKNRIDELEPRQLIDFYWSFPSDPRQIIVDGVPTMIIPEERPTPVPSHVQAVPIPGPPPDEIVNEAPLTPMEIPPPPPTTDAPVPIIINQEALPRVLPPEGYTIVPATDERPDLYFLQKIEGETDA